MQVGVTWENPEMLRKSELCSLKIVFEYFRGQPGRVTGEVITTETGHTPHDLVCKLHSRTAHEKN